MNGQIRALRDLLEQKLGSFLGEYRDLYPPHAVVSAITVGPKTPAGFEINPLGPRYIECVIAPTPDLGPVPLYSGTLLEPVARVVLKDHGSRFPGVVPVGVADAAQFVSAAIPVLSAVLVPESDFSIEQITLEVELAPLAHQF